MPGIKPYLPHQQPPAKVRMSSCEKSLPAELDADPRWGFTMRGWDFSRAEVAAAIQGHRLLNPAMELGTNVCPWNCDFCFTESPDNRDGRKRRLSDELSLERRLALIDEAADLGAKSINFVGAGEPTIDPDFWSLLDRMRQRDIVPIIYTEASLRLKSQSFSKRLFDLGATVVLKMNSLYNPDYQNRVLRGIRPKVGIPTVNYFDERKRALDMLIDIGFNQSCPTRLAFDCIICRENVGEIEDIHRFARQNNIFALFVNYLPSGRTVDGHTSAITWPEQHNIFKRLAEIDKAEFGLEHASHFPYSGGVPCTIRGLGLFVKIRGEVFDCPGELIALGNVRNDSLSAVWQKARSITSGFNGECLPRQLFWKRMASLNSAAHPDRTAPSSAHQALQPSLQ